MPRLSKELTYEACVFVGVLLLAVGVILAFL